MLINLFDTAVDSDNLGDHFIMAAVQEALLPLFPEAEFLRTPTHRHARFPEMWAGCRADFAIVGGTNIIKSHMLVRGNWRITPLDYLVWRNVVLMGAGWQHADGQPDYPTRLFFRNVLSSAFWHSVRDMQTYEKLRPYVPNVLYTACPTMWMLDEQHCAAIAMRKAKSVIFAVTWYRPAPDHDRALFELLLRKYQRIYFWPQQAADLRYVRELGITGYVPIEPSIAAYDLLLDGEDVDFVGSRLHAGIRALQFGRRALVIPVDNRAADISVSTRLPVAPRHDLAAIERWIDDPEPTDIILPQEAIDQWKGQFVAAMTPAEMAERYMRIKPRA